MSSYIERIDTISYPDGSQFLSSTIGFSADGINSNDGSPNNPRLSVDAISASETYIVLGADQVYNLSNALPLPARLYYGDGMCVLDGEGLMGRISGSNNNIWFGSLKNFIVRGFTNLDHNFRGSNGENIENCIFIDNVNQILRKEFGDVKNCFFGCDTTIMRAEINLGRWFQNVFYNSTVKNRRPDGDISSCVFHSCTIDILEVDILDFSFCLFHNTTFIIEGNAYSSLANVLSVYPTAFPNCIEEDPLFKGSLDKLEYRVVQDDSPCLQNGEAGANIGGCNIGLVFNSSNFQSSNNITFSTNGSLTLTDPLINGVIVWEDMFNRVISNPFLRLNGIPDFLNNLIRSVQSVMPSNPSKYTLEIETKDKNEPYKPIKSYRFGYKVGEDENGVSSGEDGYNELNQKLLRVIGVRVTMTVQS